MGVFFLLWLCIAAVEDFSSRKVSNKLVILGLILAIFYAGINPDSPFIEKSFFDCILGCLIAFFVFLIFYMARVMGAGDVKFAAALGAWIGWQFLLPIWALSCGFAVLHGVVVRSNLKYFFSVSMSWEDGTQGNEKKFIPYVAYLSIATVIVLMLNK